ncbi:MAG: hypothetical protein U1F36_15805 [Planctomycetota bacterium]
MSDFLLVVGDGPCAARWFEDGLRIARASGAGEPSCRIERSGVRAAVFARRAGSPGHAVEMGPSWLFATGTWFADDGLGRGDETALLGRCTREGMGSCARRLDGFFAIAGGDARSATLVTDPVGSHHVYVRQGDGAIAVAGSALWLAALDDTALDPLACQEFLATGVIYEDRTPFAAVRALPPASVIAIDGKGWRKQAHTWSLRGLRPESLDADEAVESFGSAMLDACRRIARVLDRPVADLTAGWDSRILCAFLLGAQVGFETTVTGSKDSADVVLSTRIAQRMGLRHHPLPLGAPPDLDEIERSITLTDGLLNALGYARVYRVHRELSQHFGASLNGSFGEVGRGYWWELLSPSPSAHARLDATRIAQRRYAAGAPALTLWPRPLRLDPVAHFAEVIARVDSDLDDAPLGFRLDRTYLRLRMRCWQGRIASATDRLWPCLSPLVFRSALEPLLRTRFAARDKNRLARMVLARFAPKLARMRLESGGPALPRTALNAWRFLPEAVGFAKKVALKLAGRRTHARTLEETSAPRLALWSDPRLRDLLDPTRMELGGHVDRDELRSLVDATRAPQFEHELLFGNLLALELGLRRLRELRAR